MIIVGFFSEQLQICILVLGYIPYNAVVGHLFSIKLEKTEFLYPYSLDLSQIKDKLVPAFMVLNYQYRYVDKNKIIVIPHRKRKYWVSVNTEKHTMNIVSDDKIKRNIRNIFKRTEDYGKIVYVIQHINHF